MQFWARDGGWGYRLHEHGRLTDVYNSKTSQRIPGDPRLPVQESLARLANVCGIPQALPLLKRALKSRPLFLEKKCGKFADALGVPLAIFQNIYELDRINAGITEPREIHGWQCQLLCFKRNASAPKLEPSLHAGLILSPKQRDKAVKRDRWFGILFMPFVAIVCLLLMPFLIPVFLVVSFLGMVAFVRKRIFGNATLASDAFLKQLENSEPKRAQIQGDTVINTRHGCSITLFKPAIILPDVYPQQQRPWQLVEHSLFEIELGKHGLTCLARPPGSTSMWRHGETIETRDLSASGYPIQFQKAHHSSGKNRRVYYNWDVHTPQATYNFHCTTGQAGLSDTDLDTFEKIVLTFKAPLIQIS